MKLWPVFLLLSASILPAAARADQGGTAYPATYEGGSLPLNHDKVHATLGADAVIFTQGSRRIAVRSKDITGIAYGTVVRRRLGAAFLNVVPLMHLGSSEDYYVGVAWAGDDPDKPVEVLLKMGRDEHRDFLAALQRLTGIRPVDTTQVPTVVRYPG